MKAKIYLGQTVEWIKDKQGNFSIIKKVKKEKQK
jgi:hypothetical protein